MFIGKRYDLLYFTGTREEKNVGHRPSNLYDIFVISM